MDAHSEVAERSDGIVDWVGDILRPGRNRHVRTAEKVSALSLAGSIFAEDARAGEQYAPTQGAKSAVEGVRQMNAHGRSANGEMHDLAESRVTQVICGRAVSGSGSCCDVAHEPTHDPATRSAPQAAAQPDWKQTWSQAAASPPESLSNA